MSRSLIARKVPRDSRRLPPCFRRACAAAACCRLCEKLAIAESPTLLADSRLCCQLAMSGREPPARIESAQRESVPAHPQTRSTSCGRGSFWAKLQLFDRSATPRPAENAISATLQSDRPSLSATPARRQSSTFTRFPNGLARRPLLHSSRLSKINRCNRHLELLDEYQSSVWRMIAVWISASAPSRKV